MPLLTFYFVIIFYEFFQFKELKKATKYVKRPKIYIQNRFFRRNFSQKAALVT